MSGALYIPSQIGDIQGLASALVAKADAAATTSALAGKVDQSALAAATKPKAERGLLRLPSVVRNPLYLFQAADTTSTAMNVIYPFITAVACADLRLVYQGPLTGQATIRASVELPSGTFYPVFFRGKRDGIVDALGILISDPLPIELAASTSFQTRTYAVASASGTTWPTGISSQAPGFGFNTTASDMTTSGADFTGGFSGYVYGPSLVIGAPTGWDGRIIMGIGDSIEYGQGDGTFPTTTTPGGGFFYRALHNTGGYNVAHSGETMAGFAALVNRISRMPLILSATHVISEYGVNDMVTAGTAPAMQANTLTVAKFFADRGIKFWQTTITPRVDGTNTTDTSGGSIQAFNTWLRSNPSSTIAGYFETAYAVESSPGSGLWKDATYAEPGFGPHPSSIGHAAMAAAIDLTRLV